MNMLTKLIYTEILVATPLEQFDAVPALGVRLFDRLGISITQGEVIGFLLLFFIVSYTRALYVANTTPSNPIIVRSRWQSLLFYIQKLVMTLVTGNIKNTKAHLFFPIVFLLFSVILGFNLIGLVPYSYTITSSLLVTFFISLAVFIGINIVCYREHNVEYFSLFLPGGTSAILAFLLVPIEIISYFFRPISLALRLFANMMAGHTLLKVIAGFAVTLFALSGLGFLAGFFPLLVIVPLYGLEMAVAFIQTFVFSILVCIYLNDALNLH